MSLFQPTGFQTSFSVPAFQQCAFQTPGFQTSACVTNEGRSAYWRLMFTKLQEDALKAIKPTEERKHEQVERQAAPSRTRKSKKRAEPLVELEEYPEVRFKRKPIYTNPQPVVEQFPLWLADISIEINSWLTTVIPAWEARKQAIIVQKQEAANDADMRLRILLLAA